MSDDYPAYFAAWSSVMGPPDNRLLCAWHVLHNWSKNLNRISSIEVREEVKIRMKNILQITLASEFEVEYSAYIQFLKENPVTMKYALYLEENYSQRKKHWAYCYRTGLGINTNMHLESMHKKLKYSFFGGKDVKRLDVSVSCLMRMLLDYQFNRIISQEKGERSNKFWVNRQRHLQGMDFQETISKTSSTSWAVLSSSGADIYNVQKTDRKKCCSNICELCDICIHVYRCECADNSVRMVICKHIHAIYNRTKNSAERTLRKRKRKPAPHGFFFKHFF